MESIKQTRRVAFSETDASGHVHFTSLLKWVEDAEHAILRVVDGEAFSGNVSWPRVHVECDYRSPVGAGDLVEVGVSLAGKGKSSWTWTFCITHEDALVAEGKMVTVRLML